MRLKLCQLTEYLKRNIFVGKLSRKCAPKASTIPFSENSHCMQEILFKKIF